MNLAMDKQTASAPVAKSRLRKFLLMALAEILQRCLTVFRRLVRTKLRQREQELKVAVRKLDFEIVHWSERTIPSRVDFANTWATSKPSDPDPAVEALLNYYSELNYIYWRLRHLRSRRVLSEYEEMELENLPRQYEEIIRIVKKRYKRLSRKRENRDRDLPINLNETF